jgi:hypothetical protein
MKLFHLAPDGHVDKARNGVGRVLLVDHGHLGRVEGVVDLHVSEKEYTGDRVRKSFLF